MPHFERFGLLTPVRSTSLARSLAAVAALCAGMLALCCVPPVNAQDDSVPAQRTATVVTRNSVTLIWDDPGDESITHYRISRRDLAIHVPPEFVIIDDNTGSATTSYTDDTVEPGGSYLYRITALNRQGASEWSRYARADIPAASTRNAPPPRDGSVPDRPTGLSTIATFNSVTLIWDNPGDSTTTGYVILRRNIVEQDPGVFTTVEANTGTVTTSYTDTDVEAETRYAYWIKAINEHGTSPRSGYVNVETPAVTDSDRASVSEGDTDLPNDNTTPGRVMVASAATAAVVAAVAQPTEPPDQPTGLSATATHGQVTLTWDDPQDDSITGYVILRRVRVNDTGGDFGVLVADTGTAALTYTDDTVAASTTYTYRIKAINGHGASERSRWVHIDTPAAPVPDQPTGLEATASHDSVTLTWDDPGDDSITGYVVLRRVPGVDPEGQFDELVSDTGTAATTYTDDTVAAETRYTYRIKAINEHGVSERSRWFHINVPAAPEAAEGDDPDGEGGGGSGGPGKRANVSEPSGDDLPESTSTTGEVDVGGSVTGNIDDNDDEDWFKVELEAGTRYQIDLEGTPTSRGTLPDPYMDIRSAAAPAVRILIDDDGGVGTNSRVIYTPTAAGTYYLEANTASGAGTYTLSMIVLGANGNSEADTDFPGTTATTGRVEVGASATGNIGTGGDQDWFKVVLEADKTYRIDMNGSNGGGGTLNDTRLSNIRDSSGNEISGTGNDDIDALNSNLDSQTTFTPTEAGAYYLVALGGGGTVTGTYTLSVREIPCVLNEGDIWCGVVTVEEVKLGEELLGHGFADTTSPARLDAGGLAGNPDNRTFSVGDNDYTVQGLYAGAGFDRQGKLRFWITNLDFLDDHDEGILVLTIDDVTTPRAFDGNQGSLGGLYQWDTDFDWSSTTEVTVRLQTPDDFSAGTATTGEVDVGGSVTGNIETVEDEGDWFKVVLEADTRYQIDLEGADTGRGTLVDPVIETLSTSGGDLIENTGGSDNGVDKNDRTIYTPSTSGAYYVVVLATDTGLGTYTLSVIVLGANGASEADTDFPETTATTGRVEVGASATGNIFRLFDQDWFKVDLEAGKTYQIDLKGEGAGGTLDDPRLYDIRDSSGTAIEDTGNDDIDFGNDILDSRITFTPATAGAYYLVAAHAGSGTGTYTLSVRDVTPESDDCSHDTTTTCAVDVGGLTKGNIETAGDRDWFKVVLEADTRYQIDTEGADTSRGTLADPGAGLRNASGISLVVNDDNSGVGKNARQVYTPTAAGAHYVQVSEATTFQEGTYTVSVIVLGANGASEADTDFPETTSTTGRVEVGASATGNIETGTDRDWFKVVLEAGKFYRIDLEGEVGGGTLEDPYLRNIRDSSGTEISGTENDDIHGGNSDSRVVFRPTAAGAYYLVASGYGGANDTGTYTLSLTELETRTEEGDTDFASSIATLGRVEVDGSATGEIEDVTDLDWFRVVLEEDKTYVFDLEGSETGSGTLANPHLGIRSGSAALLSTDDDSGDGANSRLEYTATADGIHYLSASAALSATSGGTYTLSVREVACTLETDDIWCGVVTVGDIEYNNSLFARGFINVTGLSGGSFKGDTDIPVGSTYTFTGIYVPVTGSFENQLIFRMDADFTSDEKDALELHIDVDGVGSTWAMSDFADSTSEGQMIREGEDFDWSSATTVTARLRPLTLPTLSIADAEGGEDDGVEFTATLTRAVSAKVTATWTASIESGDTASAADLATTKTGEVEFDANATEAKFTVPVNDDTDIEEDETFTVTLSGVSSNAQLATDPTAKGTIVDDDATVTLPTLSIGTGGAPESTIIGFAVILSATASADVTATCTASFESGDTASAADLSTTTGTATINAGSTSALCRITPVQDTIDEEDETFTVTLSGVSSNAQLAADPTAKGTINDDDDPPTLSVGDVSGAEGTALTFTVTLSAESGKTVTVDYATSAETGDTATSGTDFTAKTSTTLTFDPGQEEKTFTVQTTDDTDIEEDETFTVTLSNPSNATISDATAKGTINDDDAADDCSATTTTTCEVDVGGSAMGNIETGDDRDWFAVELEADTRYQIDVEGADTDRGTLPDPSGSLYATSLIKGDDDSGVGKNARVINTPTATDTYYVDVRSATSDTGTYTVSVIVLGANGNSEADTDFPNSNTTTGRVEVGASATGNIGEFYDEDWFRVDLEAGEVLPDRPGGRRWRRRHPGRPLSAQYPQLIRQRN